MRNTYLVTGALGCLGAWTVYHLIQEGAAVVSFDIADQGHRLNLLLTPAEQAAITFVRGDLADPEQVLAAFRTHAITHVIHLGALQVPFCRANPVQGARVNVVGTVNIFEAARQTGVAHLVQASSAAVYGPPDFYPPGLIAPDAPLSPRTLYGVYKQADEGIAQVYWQEHGLSSTALRPYTVYGVGRDQGLTSDPTKAMLAAAADRPFHIGFGGTTQLQLASDVARQFILAARQPLAGAYSFNLGGPVVAIAEIVNLIRTSAPQAKLTYAENGLPFPLGFDDRELRQHFQEVYQTPVAAGITQTIEHFRACLQTGRLTLPETPAQ